MDKQQAAREFEKYMQRCGYQRDPIIWNAVHHAWQASREALMPELVEARDALNYTNRTIPYAEGTPVAKALARINAAIGDKK